MSFPSTRSILAIGGAFLCSLLLSITPAQAGWLPDGIPVCDAVGVQLSVVGCDDGQGGLLLAWRDLRVGAQGIHVQRITAGGTQLWTDDGVFVSTHGTGAKNPAIAPDGSGGAWVVWNEWTNPNANVRMQHLDASGVPDWAPAGGAIIREGSGFFSPLRPVCTTDGSGGVIVAWAEETCPRGGPIVAQRFDDGGTAQWTMPGVVVGDSIVADTEIDIVPHGQGDGGAVLGWVKPYWTPMIELGRAQYVDANGNLPWGSTDGKGFGQVVTGSRVRVGERHRFDNGAHVLYQRSFNSPLGWTLEWRVTAIAENGYEWWDKSAGSSDDLGPDAAIYPDQDKGCVVARYIIDPVTDEIVVSGRRLHYSDGDAVWDHMMGRDPAAGSGDRPVVVWDGSYFGYRFVWPAYVDGGPKLLYRTVGRGGELLPPTGAGIVPGAVGSVTPVLTAGPLYQDPVLLGWRDERPVVETDVYATALLYDGDPPVANLIVRSFRSDPDPAIVDQPRDLRAVIANVGVADADGFSAAYWHDIVSPAGSSDMEWTYYDGLAAGDSIVIDFEDFFVASAPETWHSWMRADFEGDVDESAEDDNDRELVVEWVGVPDLNVIAFSATPVDPEVGSVLRYDLSVRNDGSADSGPFELHVYYDRSSAPGVGDPGDLVFSVSAGLAPDETIDLGAGDIVHQATAQWSSYALADEQGAVAESDEGNNLAGPIGVTWKVPEQEGWPVDAGTKKLSSPVIASFPTQPSGLRAVLVTSTDGHCYAWDGLGRVLPGWPYDAGAPIQSSPAVADLDLDGSPEVVFGDDAGFVHCLDVRGRPLWTYDARAAVVATPAIGNLLFHLPIEYEVVVGGTDGNLHLLDAQGNITSGWPVRCGDSIVASPAIGNLDGAGFAEIVAIALTTRPVGSSVHVLRSDGSSYGPSWPIHGPAEIHGSPALGNVFGDDDLEIIAGDLDGWLHAWPLAGGPGSLAVDLGAPIRASIALANLDKLAGGKVAMVAATDVYVGTPPVGGYWKSMLWTVEGDGTVPTGWPVEIRRGFADCRAGDGAVVWGTGVATRVAVGSEYGDSFVFDVNGTRQPGHTMPADGPIGGSLAVGELDSDGHLEVVVAGWGEVRCYDLLAGSYQPHAMQWAMFGHEPMRTRCYGLGIITGVGPGDDAVPSATRWLRPHPNPFNPMVELPFELGQAGFVEVVVFDIAGREVARLPRRNLEAGLHRARWNGTDARGSAVASGVYLIELQSEFTRDHTRVVLLR